MLSLRIGLVAALAVFTTHAHFSVRQLHHFKHQVSKSHGSHADPDALWYTNQTLDHFSPQDTRQWSQRYFLNATYFDPSVSNAVFLQLGGEGAIGSDYVRNLEYVAYARQHGAMIVALEHRFYGASLPFPTLTTANLAYLSSMQALEDAVQFVNWLKDTHPMLNADTQVYLFGCSYSGALVSWGRQKYPATFAGAVAGSGPVEAKLDFYEYLQTVQVSLATFAGDACVANVQNATDQVQALLTTPAGQAKVQTLFKTCTLPNNTLDISTFMQGLMGNWMGIVQYNDEGVSSMDINSLCATMANYSDPLQGYVAISDAFLQGEDRSCVDISYESQVTMLKDTDPPATGVGARSWTYQTCTQFGYFQTTDAPAGTQPFGNLAPVSYSVQLCNDVFGLGIDLAAAINTTNQRYGGNKPEGTTRVAFIDGTIDPWRPLTVTEAVNEESPVITIVGTAHCATSFQLSPNDPPGVAPAYQQVSQLLGTWIHNPQ